MNNYIYIFLIFPLLGLLLIAFADNKQEKYISKVTTILLFGQLLFYSGFLGNWLMEGMPFLIQKSPALYKTTNADFALKLFFDRITAAFLFVSTLLTLLVAVFSTSYMHREKGFKRFFNNLLFFNFGISIILLSGNFETLFIGWEVIGVTSFFLISFYRDRYLPVKNALKVVSLYRLADICLLLGIWLCHHLFHKNIDFQELTSLDIIHDHYIQFLAASVFLIAALIKSAQFPFTSWLPRAMEGPSTSSAIFYGALSVHAGVFLMMRTYPLWSGMPLFKVIVIALGALTCLLASMMARVQSSVKTQIAYSSSAQIGLMFIEVALGWHELALIHFMGNAFLKCYQLLVSPSVLSYQIHDQFFNFKKPDNEYDNSLVSKIKLTLYMMSIKEWSIDQLHYNYLWMPLKRFGQLTSKISSRSLFTTAIPIFGIGLYCVYHTELLPLNASVFIPEIFSILALVIVSRAFVERGSAFDVWSLLVLSQLFISLSIGFNESFDFTQVHIYLSGIFVSAAVGLYCLYKLRNAKKSITLDKFNGHSYEHPRLAFIFIVACLGLAGFPITPTFIGEDLLLGHIHQNQFLLTLLTSLNFILDGIVVFRLYGRLFMGPQEVGYHEVAYRSS
jgi:NADH-quinone oxidoreductase subunit L